ncbi:MAG: extracellular solute-binding protein [Candidatus Gallimonas sp.]
MKGIKKHLALALGALMLVVPAAGCGPSSVTEGKTKVTLWAWGDEAEINAFSQLFKDYNNTNQDNIYVDYVKKPSSNYYSNLEVALGGRQPPDLFYVGDSYVKRYASDYLEDLTPYISQSSKIDLGDIWSTLMERYRFDTETFRYSESAPIWGLPKDIGPTVVFYNEDAFRAKGITVISASDDDNDGIVTYNGVEYEARGYNPQTKVFNNQIAVTWNDTAQSDFSALNELLASGSTNALSHQTEWSFYSSWWFLFGWSVGGDCIQFVETDDPTYYDGYYEFTLDNDNPNYRVLEDVTINGHEYSAGDFVDYFDLESMKNDSTGTAALVETGKVIELPSILDAFTYWYNLFADDYSPKPEDISNEKSLFINEQTAMFVTGRYNVVDFRQSCSFAWDVAPLPRHENGIEAGHSGSMCLAMSKNCKVKDAAFKVMEYACGAEGQEALAKTGFNVPNQISVANDPNGAFLSSTERPYNNSVFLRAAEIQRGGDWTYLSDDAWIEVWAPTLNGDVLNGKTSITQLFATYKNTVDTLLKNYTKKGR